MRPFWPYSLLLFLVGGGFVTLLYAAVSAIAAAKIDAQLPWWRAHLLSRLSRLLARMWPSVLIVYVCWVAASWVIGTLFNEFMLHITPAATAVTPVGLALILVGGIAHDIQTAQRMTPSL